MQDQSLDIKDLSIALTEVQRKLKPAAKDAANPFFKSKYASLKSVIDTCREGLAESGFAVTQSTGLDQGGIPVLVTTLMHKSGQWIKGRYPIVSAKKDDPQAFGSAMTYARRYALSAMVGISTEEDDDGEAAVVRQPAQTYQAPVSAPQTSSAPKGTGPSPAQINRLHAILKQSAWSEAEALQFIASKWNKQSFETLHWKEYKEFCDQVLINPPVTMEPPVNAELPLTEEDMPF